MDDHRRDDHRHDAHDRSRRERRAPICPACGVTALPLPVSDPDGGFRCENPDCELFDEPV